MHFPTETIIKNIISDKNITGYNKYNMTLDVKETYLRNFLEVSKYLTSHISSIDKTTKKNPGSFTHKYTLM